ncbi:sensor histidine kinase [Streptomyces catenulae]|uniref:Sensor histidine kinase n=1 Tax=Streptomyces catenulae TaxID=66875 RepID=A0ABV2YZZ3_9ACTN|nr:sensor histidine kinase [Streptomyces catenulae]
MTTVSRPAGTDERWEQFHRWGPYALLAVSTALAVPAGPLLPTAGTPGRLVGPVAAALALQLWWHHRRRTAAPGTVPALAYYALRTALAFALTWLNPFYAIFAVMGNFDIGVLLPPRLQRFGLALTAVTMAGSQSGGLPPGPGAVGWGLFGGLFLLHFGLGLLFSHLAKRDADRAAAKAAAITELERANARLEQALQENAGLHAQLLVQAREAGVADERRRLAAEIHDTIAQGLTGIITQLQAATDTPDPHRARSHVARAAALARRSLGEARRSVQDLGPGDLEHDALPEALEKLVRNWSARTGARAGLTLTGTVEPLHDELEATLLRIAQEALANVDRHAAADRVGVTLSYMGDEVSLDIRDDGRGFDPLALPPRSATGGFGLGGMRARAERVAGTVDIESEPGAGTAVSARVPLVRHG